MFELEKVVYELRYELNNRPDWVAIPVAGIVRQQLLTVFELEKVVYELRYELNNRPDWVAIPVAGITRLLESEL